MQEKFALRKAIKKVAAVTTSVALLGMTLTGAMAALDEYPSQFPTSSTVVVVGADASADDNLAAVDVVTSLGGAGSATTVVTTGNDEFDPLVGLGSDFEKVEELPLGVALSSSTEGFGDYISARHVEGLFDSKIDIDMYDQQDEYNAEDRIFFGNDASTEGLKITGDALTVETGLTSGNDIEDWGSDLFIPVMKKSWGYFLVFTDTLKTDNYISNATSTSTTDEDVELTFLGKNLIIDSADSNSVTVNVGQKFWMQAGDKVIVDGVEVELRQTSSASATVVVDGEVEVIDLGDEKNVGPIEILVDKLSAEEGIEYDSAVLFIGEDARKSYNNGDEFIGEDDDNPAWRWVLENLNTADPTLGILWDLNLDTRNEDDNPLYTTPLMNGGALCLPFEYACLVFDGVSEDDDGFDDYEFSTGTEDLYFATVDAVAGNANVTADRVLYLDAKDGSDDGLNVQNAAGTWFETDSIAFAISGYDTGWTAASNGTLEIFYSDDNNANRYVRLQEVAAGTVLENNITIETADTTLNMDINWVGGAPQTADSANGTFIINPEGTYTTDDANITVFFEADETNNVVDRYANDINYIGHADSDNDDATDFAWGTRQLSARGADLRTSDGIIIRDPESNSGSDTFEFSVPQDVNDYKAKIVVRTSGASVSVDTTSTGMSYMVDTDLDDVQAQNVVAIGGPAVNSVSADLLGLEYPTYGSSGLLAWGDGEAVLELMENGDNWALVVAGYNAEDTQRAGKVLLNSGEFDLTGDSMVVTGTSLEVSGITVEAA